MEMAVMKIRLDKYLSDTNCGTRSEVKKKIRQGLVCVEQKIIKSPEYKVDTEIQNISVQGKLLSYEKYRYYMLYKPAGVVSATTDRRDQTVLDLIPELKGQDYFPVGRLDKDTVGLLLITNDGPLAHRLLSPAHHVDKIYEAKIQGMADQTDIEKFAAGVEIGEKKPCAPAKLQILSVDEKTQTSYISLTIHEGKFHQVKRMFHALGKEVTFLKRVQMAELSLDETLKPGEYRELTEEEKKKLC